MPRVLDWPACRNVRDLGGLAAGSARRVRVGALIRSDNLDRLTGEGIAAIRRAAVTRIVDVRSEWECRSFPSPFAEDPIWRNAPLADPEAPDAPDASLVEQYATLLDGYPHRIAAAVALIADAPPGGVLVHCHAGKDRTGLIVALALRIAGVRATDIAADYAVIGDVDVPTLVGIDAPSGELPPELQAPRAATMLTTLGGLDDTYGSVAEYLRIGGCTVEQQGALRRRLTT